MHALEQRLQWLEPSQAFLGIEHQSSPDLKNPYNPAEFSLIANEPDYRRAYYFSQLKTPASPHTYLCSVPPLIFNNTHTL